MGDNAQILAENYKSVTNGFVSLLTKFYHYKQIDGLIFYRNLNKGIRMDEWSKLISEEAP